MELIQIISTQTCRYLYTRDWSCYQGFIRGLLFTVKILKIWTFEKYLEIILKFEKKGLNVS